MSGLTHIEGRLYVASDTSTLLDMSAITQDDPGVVTYTSYNDNVNPSNGQFVMFQDDVEGMVQVESLVCRIKSVNNTTNRFALEGVNTTAYDDFIGGTARIITDWALLGDATDDLNFDNTQPQKIDRTRLLDKSERVLLGRNPPRVVTANALFNPEDSEGFALVQAAADNRKNLAFKLVLKSREIILWNGIPYVGPPQFGKNDAIKRQIQVSLGCREVAYPSKINRAPRIVGTPGPVTMDENTTFNLKPYLTAWDPDLGQTLIWQQVLAPNHGTLTITSTATASGGSAITPSGTITYTPTADYVGTDTFIISVNDGEDSGMRKINVTVEAVA